MKIGIIGGGGNVAEACGAYLLSIGHEVVFFRSQQHICVPGTPRRLPRSQARLRLIRVVGDRAGQSAFNCSLDAVFVGRGELPMCDALMVAMPAYMHERLPSLLPFAFANKIVILLCERFLNSGAFLASCMRMRLPPPRMLISHKSEPVDAVKMGHDGPCHIWRLKRSADVAVVLGDIEEARAVCNDVWRLPAGSMRFGVPLSVVMFQNLNAIGHACVDLHALPRRAFRVGQPHYTPETYTPTIVARINEIAREARAVSVALTGYAPKTLAEHEITSYEGARLMDCAGTSVFRFESPVAKARLAPVWYRASGFEDVGWSLVPLEKCAQLLAIPTPKLSSLIDDWNRLCRTDYRAIGRDLESCIRGALQAPGMSADLGLYRVMQLLVDRSAPPPSTQALKRTGYASLRCS